MIDVYAPSDLLPSGTERRIGEDITRAVLRAEGVSAPGPFHLENTAAFIHRMDPSAIQTAAQASARTIRVQIVTPPAALTRSGQKQLVQDVTAILADVCGDPSQTKRTWVPAHRSGRRRLGHRRHCVWPRGICRSGGRGRKEVRVWRQHAGYAAQTVLLGKCRRYADARVSRSRMGRAIPR